MSKINDIKLQKLVLGPEWIDLSFGEPKVIGQALFKQLNRFGDPFKMPTLMDIPSWEYQPAAGKQDLVNLLEKKYNAKVVVTNGAKQGLAAALYAFKTNLSNSIYFPVPYYPSNPSIVESVGLVRLEEGYESSLITSPNNPDGINLTNEELLAWQAKGPMIHDAAYYTEIYLPEGQKPIPVGDMQVYSISKMYGLSGLRIGYVVCHNEKYYNDVVSYIEGSTAGVSCAAQDVIRNVETFLGDNPHYHQQFIKDSREALKLSRSILENLDPEVIAIERSSVNAMFAWGKAGPRLDYQSAKVNILPGEIFGQPGMVRLNIAHPANVIVEAVERLNKHKI